jgi:hypothetical protein
MAWPAAAQAVAPNSHHAQQLTTDQFEASVTLRCRQRLQPLRVGQPTGP